MQIAGRSSQTSEWHCFGCQQFTLFHGCLISTLLKTPKWLHPNLGRVLPRYYHTSQLRRNEASNLGIQLPESPKDLRRWKSKYLRSLKYRLPCRENLNQGLRIRLCVTITQNESTAREVSVPSALRLPFRAHQSDFQYLLVHSCLVIGSLTNIAWCN